MTQLETKPRIVRTSFNIEEPILEEFKASCHREGVTMSQAVQEGMKVYAAAHSAGKPQLRMDHFNGKAPHPKRTCSKCGQQAPLLKVQYISGSTGELCKDCVDKWRVRGSFGTVKKVLGVAN